MYSAPRREAVEVLPAAHEHFTAHESRRGICLVVELVPGEQLQARALLNGVTH